MLPQLDSYEAICRRFEWVIPEFFNIGLDICDKWADDPRRLALIHERRDGWTDRYSFAELRRLSNQAANLFAARGIEAGDRIGILLPQEPETAIAHIAAFKIGAISVPLFTLFGFDALQFRLSDCAAKLLVTDATGMAKIAQIRAALPHLQSVFCIDAEPPGTENFGEALRAFPERFAARQTRADDPALIIYTSGTTGKPKGALHAHRTLLGHLPGVEMSHNLLPRQNDLMWTPADWAWIGGLLDLLFASWHHGIPVVAHRFEKFDPEAAFELMDKLKVRNAFLPPTALTMMRSVPRAKARWNLELRSIASGGESLGAELLQWGHETFGLAINEFYGQTECNMVLSSCEALFAAKPGVIGKAAPGHQVEIVDDSGRPLPAGEQGIIGIRRPDPVMFLGYWNNSRATQEKFAGEYLLTGDTGRLDVQGYFKFVGRNDDVITSAGYRIGPGPIEDCLLGHAAVRQAAVVGVPDPERTEVVKAFLVLNEGWSPSAELTREIQDHVRLRLAAHEYPRQVRYVDALPLTSTGKIIRRELRGLKD
ncbi:MAG: acyl-CoA synthetase [Betaproteobacteria bacterium]